MLSSVKAPDQNSFIKQKENNYFISTGSYLVSKDIAIPTNCSLTIEKGTTLRFLRKTILYLQGALFVEGTKENPIIFTAEDNSWGGVLVSNSNDRSKVNFLTCSNANGIGPIIQEKGIDRNGWMLTGAITFNRSNVDIFNSSFIDINSEDALNIVSSDFNIQGCFFSKLASDAFDGDFVSGTIKDCFFSEINGDGVDFSGSRAEVRNSIFNNIADKAISVGETFPTSAVEEYAAHCDYLIFDTKGKSPGGNGVLFNWDLLKEYSQTTPFLLSGGIGPVNAEQIKRISHTAFAGVDLNSGFETSPGIKNIELLKAFLYEIR